MRDLLGATDDPARDFPREPLAHGLDNDATLNQVTGSHVSAYLDAAEFLAQDTLDQPPLRRSCPATRNDQACGELFIATIGLKAFRRPLNAEERANLNSLFTTLNATEGFDGRRRGDAAVDAPVAPVPLPRRAGRSAPVPVPVVTLGGFELASRLSYFLWGTMPDDAAARGRRQRRPRHPRGPGGRGAPHARRPEVAATA